MRKIEEIEIVKMKIVLFHRLAEHMKFSCRHAGGAVLTILLSLAVTASFGQEKFDSNAEIKLALEKGTLKRGVYANFGDFLSNEPSIVDSFLVNIVPRDKEIWEGTFSLTPRYAAGSKKVKKVWGFSDGEKAYVFNEIEYFEVDVEDDELIFYGYDKIEDSGAMAAGVLGGVIGGAIYAAAQLSKAKSQKVRYRIDPSTGLALHPNAEALANRAEFTKELVIYRRSKKEALENFVFSLDDSLKYTFPPDSYVLLKYRISDLEIQICFGSSFDNCNNVSLENEGTTFVKCSIAEGTSIITVEKVDEDEGWFDWAKVEKVQDKRGPQIPESVREN